MSEELLPCPFCGGEAIDCEIETGNWRVGCNNARCRGDWFASKFYPSKADAIEAWNNRAQRAQQTCQMTEIFCGTESGIEWVCSECGSTCFVSEPLDTDEQPRYCPNCGAKVVEE